MTNSKQNVYINRNIKLMPSYVALTWDVIFVWTISTMFFTNVKGLSYSQVIALDSILMLIGCLICVPINKLFERVPTIWATRIATLGYGVYLLLCIIGKNYAVFVLAQFFLSFGYCLNSVKINNALVENLNVAKRGKDYQKIFGQGLGIYYVLEALGAIVITYIYSWNPYAAYWTGFAVVVVAEIISIFLKEPKKFQPKNVNIDAKANSVNAKEKSSLKTILKSSFFVCLLMYMFFMRGALSIVGSGGKVYLQQLTNLNAIPVWMFGYLYSGIKIASAISSKYQFKIDTKFGVKSLLIFTLFTIATFFLIGVIYIIDMSALWAIILIVVLLYIQGALYSPVRIFANNYMNVCIDPKDIDKAYSFRVSVEYAGYAIISALYAFILGATSDNYGLTNILFMAILTIPLLITMVLSINQIVKTYAKKKTVIKDEYVNDDYE